jgi:hypothetical protein
MLRVADFLRVIDEAGGGEATGIYMTAWQYMAIGLNYL